MARVLIVDDQLLVGAGLAAIIRTAPGYEVVGVARDGDEAVALAAETAPDVVLMDIRMPGLNGIEATRRILAGDGPVPRILVLTTFDQDEYVYEALRAGASGYLLKDTPPNRLLAALRAVEAGDLQFAPTVVRRMAEAYCAREPADGATQAGESWSSDLDALTTRERDVLRLVAAGQSNTQIADGLFVSESTVKTHLNRAMTKLNLSSRAQVVVMAYESGLVVPRRSAARGHAIR